MQRALTEGELWAREQLATLLEARFTPVAIARFLAASQRRANAVRAERPELARRSEPTRIGRDLEGLVDACFAAAALRAARRDRCVGGAVVAGELARLTAGFGYALYVYFGRADAPDPRVTRAARATTPVRVGGLLAAGLGRRRLADALIGGGALWSVAVLVTALRDRG